MGVCQTPDLIKIAIKGLENIYKKDFLYKKAGIILGSFTCENIYQQNLFSKLNDKKKQNLMHTIDLINSKTKKKAVFFASEGINHKKDKPLKFTTDWNDLIIVK